MDNVLSKSSSPTLKSFTLWSIFTIILGVIFHFIYDLSSNSFLIGLFFPINESIWEHLKLVLLPITIFGIIYSYIHKENSNIINNFWYYISMSVILSMLIIPISHYTYKFIFKSVPDFINIIIYILSIIISFYYLYKNVSNEYINPSSKNKNSTGIILITILFLTFIIFTIYPPRLELFRDPINDTFGIYLL